MKEITLQAYQQRFLDFHAAIEKVGLITVVAGEALKDFPDNLSGSASEAIEFIAGQVMEVLDDNKTNPCETTTETAKQRQSHAQKIVAGNPIVKPTLKMMLAEIAAGRKTIRPDFDSLLYPQELVMLIAHLDAFMTDSLKIMCHKQPKMLQRDTTFTWGEIIESETLDNLIEKMVDDAAFVFGMKSIKDRIEQLQEKHGVDIQIAPNDLIELDRAEKLRHIIIHNGGKVSRTYLTRTGRTDVKLGEEIKVTSEYMEEIGSKVKSFGRGLFAAVAVKFFKATEEQLTDGSICSASASESP